MTEQNLDLSTATGHEPDPMVELAKEAPTEALAAAVPEYTPNFKFKVRDEEHEFDERIRPAVTSKEAEDHLRDVYTKAYGLDGVKKRAEDFERNWNEEKTRYQDLHSKHETLNNVLSRVAEIRQKDFGTFQKVWEIPDKAVLDRAREILSVMEDRDGQERLNRIYDDRVQALNQQGRLQQESQQSQALHMQMHSMKMENALLSPEVSSFAAEYDKRMGPGSFRREVDSFGALEYHNNNRRYVEPQVAVSTVHQRLKTLMGSVTPAPAAAASEEPNDPIKVQPIPNMGSGKTGAPVARKKFSSVEEMRQYAKSLE